MNNEKMKAIPKSIQKKYSELSNLCCKAQNGDFLELVIKNSTDEVANHILSTSSNE